MHLQIRDIGIPVRNGAPRSSPRVIVHTCQPKSGWIERCRALAIRPERLAVKIQLGVELARAPAIEHLFDRRLVDLKHLGIRAEIRSGCDYRADVEIAIRPAIEAATDSRQQGVIYRRVTQRALDADRCQSL